MKKKILLACIGIFAVVSIVSVTLFFALKETDKNSESNSNEQEEVKKPEYYSYLIKEGSTYSIIDAESIKKVSDNEIINIVSADEYSFTQTKVEDDKIKTVYGKFKKNDSKPNTEISNTDKNVKFSPDGKYNIETVFAQYFGGMRLIVRNSEKFETIRNLLTINGEYYWLDNDRIVLTDTLGNCETVEPVSGQSCEFANKRGISIFDIKNNVLTPIWSEDMTQGDGSPSISNLYGENDKVYFTKRISNSSGYKEPYNVSYTSTFYEYDSSTKQLKEVEMYIFSEVESVLKSEKLPAGLFSVERHPFVNNSFIVKLTKNSSYSNFYIYDRNDKTLKFLAFGDDIIFSKFELNGGEAKDMIEKTQDGNFTIFKDIKNNYSINLPTDWIWTSSKTFAPQDILLENIGATPIDLQLIKTDLSLEEIAKRYGGGYTTAETMMINGYSTLKTVDEGDGSYLDYEYYLKNTNIILRITFRAYSINAYSEPPIEYDYKGYLDEFDAIVKSIRFLN